MILKNFKKYHLHDLFFLAVRKLAWLNLSSHYSFLDLAIKDHVAPPWKISGKSARTHAFKNQHQCDLWDLEFSSYRNNLRNLRVPNSNDETEFQIYETFKMASDTQKKDPFAPYLNIKVWQIVKVLIATAFLFTDSSTSQWSKISKIQKCALNHTYLGDSIAPDTILSC